jgi:hypothetical protein
MDSRLRLADHADVEAVDFACRKLAEARDALACAEKALDAADAPKARFKAWDSLRSVRAALKSAEGARRHVRRRRDATQG